MPKRFLNFAATMFVVLLLTLSSAVSAEDTIKIGYTDQLSGPFAQVGQEILQQLQYNIDYLNKKRGALGEKFELVVYDNQSQPSEALIAYCAAP